MSTSESADGPQENHIGHVEKLVQIANVYGSVNLVSPKLVDMITEAVGAQRGEVEVKRMQQSAAKVVSMLRARNALYANLDNEIWKYVFQSLRELREAFTLAAAELEVDGPESIRKLLAVMVEATREYLADHEASYLRFMERVPEGTAPLYWEREWPDLATAAQDLLCLRTVLVAAIQPLNGYVRRGEEIPWREGETALLRIGQAAGGPPAAIPAARPADPDLSVLQQALDSPSDLVRLTAVQKAAATGQPGAIALLIAATSDKSWQIREVAFGALRDNRSRLDDEAILALARTRRDEAGEILVSIGGRAVPVLIAELREPQASFAMKALGRIGDKRAARPILDLVPEWQWPTQLDLIYWALIRIGPAAAPVYEDALSNDEEPIRRVAAEVLGIIGTPDLVPVLLRAAADPSARVRAALVRGCHLRPDKDRKNSPWLYPVLERLLAEADPRVRKEVVITLWVFVGTAAIPLLRTALTDDDPDVREEAARALEHLTLPA
jgi:HEAT repeat protein